MIFPGLLREYYVGCVVAIVINIRSYSKSKTLENDILKAFVELSLRRVWESSDYFLRGFNNIMFQSPVSIMVLLDGSSRLLNTAI